MKIRITLYFKVDLKVNSRLIFQKFSYLIAETL